MHYACAYGWYECMQLLMEADADLNAANDWKLQPLAVAYLKGHILLVEELLKTGKVDVNAQDTNGQTLVSTTGRSVVPFYYPLSPPFSLFGPGRRYT